MQNCSTPVTPGLHVELQEVRAGDRRETESLSHHQLVSTFQWLELTSSITPPPAGVKLEPIGETTEEQTLKLNYTDTRVRRRWRRW